MKDPDNEVHVTLVALPDCFACVAADSAGPLRVSVAEDAGSAISDIRTCVGRPLLQGGEHALRAASALFGEGRALPLAEPPPGVKGTPFQRAVWKAVCAIPEGRTASYGEIARSVGSPGAARAVANACAANALALVIPCHRVVPAGGGAGGYRWGAALKARLLAAEAENMR
jgi:AraC family transcriptional regulator of adaptative response/methylated-DNA-[protein]-cysteine methyltransferase